MQINESTVGIQAAAPKYKWSDSVTESRNFAKTD